ncbi:MAG: DUF6748 domain-containing protein [Polyangiaceae bacterium]
MRSALFALGLAALSLSACSASTDTQSDDTTEDSLSSNRNSGYFMVTRHDARRCVSPICGGYYVKRVNASKTPCADGIYRDECYASSLDLTALGLSETEQDAFNTKLTSGGGIVRASFHKFVFGGNHLGNLVATEGWAAATGSSATGDFYRVADNGIRCVRAPCPSTSAGKLNSTKSSNVTRVDFTSTDNAASTADLDAAGTALGTHDGVLVSGTLALPKCIPSDTSCGPTIITNEFFLRVTHTASTLGQSCGGRGQQSCATGEYCSWTAAGICGRADASGTCTTRPQACIELYRPVCGCDGQTYSNSCFAASAGVSVATSAACPVR